MKVPVAAIFMVQKSGDKSLMDEAVCRFSAEAIDKCLLPFTDLATTSTTGDRVSGYCVETLFFATFGRRKISAPGSIRTDTAWDGIGTDLLPSGQPLSSM